VSSFSKYVRQAQVPIYVPGHEANIAEYYTPEGNDWGRWGETLSLNPILLTGETRVAYYKAQLHSRKYGLIVLFYLTTFSTSELSGSTLVSNQLGGPSTNLLTAVAENSGGAGLSALTQAIVESGAYSAVVWGPYNTSNISGTHGYGAYVIWRRGPQP
jgi:hypothetical protein